jgi:hypothetical protein
MADVSCAPAQIITAMVVGSNAWLDFRGIRQHSLRLR